MHHKLLLQNNCNTVYLRNIVIFRYIIVDTMNKGNDDDDDDDDNNLLLLYPQ